MQLAMETNRAIPDDARLQGALRDVFGFSGFRPHQAEIVEAIFQRHDAFVVMPTGGGKSLCYQLPAYIMPGVCLVVSPLIALMKDQVDAAQANGLRAAYLNSSQTPDERNAVEAQLLEGSLKLLYVSPERFAMPEFLATLKRSQLSFAAIDEAHCISEWGHDFRPDYLNLSRLITEFPGLAVAAFTATATFKVQQDIIARLGLRSPLTVRASFNRPNLFYKVEMKDNLERQLHAFVCAHPGEQGIIYRTTRKSVEATAAHLCKAGLRALPYHAGLSDVTRAANQDAFNKDEVEVMVATIAFGMGIDKSNVRYVLHGDLPKNIESYYQETGRGGRDGEPAQCVMFFSYGDIVKIRYFFNTINDAAEKEHASRSLNEMVRYATLHACRRRQMLGYFGEVYPETGCGACDVCAGEVERTEATRGAQILLSAISRTGQRFGAGHIFDIVTGADTPRIRELGHDQLKTYGAGRDRDKRFWRLLLDNLLAQGLIAPTAGTYPGLALQPKAREVLFENRPVFILQSRAAAPRPSAAAAASNKEEPYDEALFQALRVVRKRLAAAQNLPPFVIFSDRSLREMARRRPASAAELGGIFGVGETKLARYGTAFLDAIRATPL
ncbi:MAG: DNA helicase RecQ [bacterium]